MSEQALKRKLEVNEQLDAASLREEPAVMVQAITMTVLIIAEVATTTTNLTTVATNTIVAC